MQKKFKKSWQKLEISTVLKISISLESLENLNKNLDATKSQFKSLNFKNLDQDKHEYCLISFKNWSRQTETSRSRLVSTVEAPNSN